MLTKFIDEEALKEMFKGYDMKADNATDVHLNGNGRLVGEPGAKQARKLANYLIGEAKHEIVLTSYTFDLAPLVEALRKAAERGIPVTVFTDHSHLLTGTTNAMPGRLSELADNGVQVLLCRDDKGRTGIQHPKTLQSQ